MFEIEYQIERIEESNYNLFEDMIFWRETGSEREPVQTSVSSAIVHELANPNLYVYAVRVEERFVGWISLVYIPKVGKWKGRGHVYIDELWVEAHYRGRSLAKALMQKADELCRDFDAAGIRLYVNMENPAAKGLYENCGFREDGRALFMGKDS